MKFLIVVVLVIAAIRLSRKGSGRKRTYTTPGGKTWDLFTDAIRQNHLLIAGATGSGKSVLIHGLITTMLYRLPFDQPNGVQLILIDPKKVELSQYKDLPHTITHAAGYTPSAWIAALNQAVSIMDRRYIRMEKQKQRTYQGGDLYVVIDEWASIFKSTAGKQAYQLLMRLTSEGRAARVHVILATQVPKANIIPTEIRENFDCRFALRTANSVQSRVIMEQSGCESLPRFGQGFYITPEGTQLYDIPFVTDEEIQNILAWWSQQKKAA